jgi:hypothetical protein
MPPKLPDPEEGTEAQPGPNGTEVVVALVPDDVEADAEDGLALAEDAVDDPLEPHAAAPSARPAAAAVTIMILYRIVTP